MAHLLGSFSWWASQFNHDSEAGARKTHSARAPAHLTDNNKMKPREDQLEGAPSTATVKMYV